MKKILALILCLMMILPLVACAGEEAASNTAEENKTQAETKEETKEEIKEEAKAEPEVEPELTIDPKPEEDELFEGPIEKIYPDEEFFGDETDIPEVTPEEIEEALSLVEPEFLDVLREAAVNIRAFHEKQVRNSFILNEKDGVVIGQKVTPIEKVGL